MRPPAHSPAANKLTTWLALWLMVTMLGQALLPTVAYMRSDANPGLWDEICSVYGVRKNTVQAPSDQLPSHHADCPLCLQVFHDTILDAPLVAVTFHLLFLNQISLIAPASHPVNQRTIIPEARGPPDFN